MRAQLHRVVEFVELAFFSLELNVELIVWPMDEYIGRYLL